MRAISNALIWIFAALFAISGLLFGWKGVDFSAACCLILISLVLLGIAAWFEYRELKNREIQTQLRELPSLLEKNKKEAEDYRTKFHDCVEKAKKIVAEIGGEDANSFNLLVEKICEGERKILEKLLEERAQIIRALSGGKSDSDFC